MQRVGRVARSVPADDNSDIRTMDGALVEPAANVVGIQRIGEIWVTSGIYEPIAPEHVEMVHTFGAQSGFRTGEIASINADLEVEVGNRVITYQGGYLVVSTSDDGPFAAAGDSGSTVVTADGRVVGMVVAKEHNPEDPDDPSAYAFVFPIRVILAALDVALID